MISETRNRKTTTGEYAKVRRTLHYLLKEMMCFYSKLSLYIICGLFCYVIWSNFPSGVSFGRHKKNLLFFSVAFRSPASSSRLTTVTVGLKLDIQLKYARLNSLAPLITDDSFTLEMILGILWPYFIAVDKRNTKLVDKILVKFYKKIYMFSFIKRYHRYLLDPLTA